MAKLTCEERRELRSRAAKNYGLDFYAIGIKGPGRPEKRNRVEWPSSDAFVDALLLRKYPKLGTSEKHRAKADTLSQILYMYFRIQISASEIAETLKMTLKKVERKIEEANKAAKVLIQENANFLGEEPDSFRRATKPGVTLVKNSVIVTNEPRLLKRLIAECDDKNIRQQALRALEEIEARRKELSEIAAHDRGLLAA